MTATAYDWHTTRNRAIQAFNGDTPGANAETAIQQHFQEHPGRVHNLIDAIGRRVQDGSVRSGWAILRHELDQPAPSNIVATDNTERRIQLDLAQHWIHNAGGYIDRQTELVDCLFGDLGPLRAWPELEAQLVEQWQRERPRFARAEQETEDLAAHRVAHRAKTKQRLRRATNHAAGPDEADAHTQRVHDEIERARLAWADTIAPEPEDEAA